jgi:hypothetical protein
MHQLDSHGAFADPGSNSLGGTMTDVSRDEDAGNTRLEVKWIAIRSPAGDSLPVATRRNGHAGSDPGLPALLEFIDHHRGWLQDQRRLTSVRGHRLFFSRFLSAITNSSQRSIPHLDNIGVDLHSDILRRGSGPRDIGTWYREDSLNNHGDLASEARRPSPPGQQNWPATM